MKPTSILFFAVLSMFLFCSCQKELADYIPPASDSTVVDTTIVSDTSFFVKSYAEDVYNIQSPGQRNSDSFLLSYDNNGRLLSLTSVKATGSKLIYSYSSKSFVMDLYNGSVLSIHETFFLSGQHVDSTIQYNDEGDTTTEKYIYSGKRLMEVTEYDYTKVTGSVPATTTKYTYNVNGDLSSTAAGDTITSYTYTKKTINNLNTGLKYFFSPAHLPDGVSYIIPGDTHSGTHTYTFDNMGRLTVDKLKLDDGSIAEKRYYY